MAVAWATIDGSARIQTNPSMAENSGRTRAQHRAERTQGATGTNEPKPADAEGPQSPRQSERTRALRQNQTNPRDHLIFKWLGLPVTCSWPRRGPVAGSAERAAYAGQTIKDAVFNRIW